MRDKRKLLELAVRVRQWQLDEQVQSLRDALSAQSLARGRLDQAQQQREAQQRTRARLLSQPQFHAGQLVQHAAYDALMREQANDARTAFDTASDEADRQRAEVQSTLQQRDAFRQRLERVNVQAALQSARAQAREGDAGWIATQGDVRDSPP